MSAPKLDYSETRDFYRKLDQTTKSREPFTITGDEEHPPAGDAKLWKLLAGCSNWSLAHPARIGVAPSSSSSLSSSLWPCNSGNFSGYSMRLEIATNKPKFRISFEL